ncbi:MAG: ABC transporter permease [Alphaproteobacteria bacterium]
MLTGLSALDRKLARDLVRLWAQALAVALVMACGVATLILAVGAYRSLEETREAYYERYRFGDVFATATRAPNRLADRIAEIPGVAAVQTRITQGVILDIEGMREPATGIALSLPDHAEPVLNRLYLRRGRLPDAGRADEVTINEPFANAHGFAIGDRFRAIIDGTRRTLVIVGVALSPEFVYALGPGDIVPDPRRFGVLWMSETALAAITDRAGAFNDVSLTLMRGANQKQAIAALDHLLERYGGTSAYGRADQPSDAFLDSELTQLRAMAKVIPPVFLLVSAFLINMVLSRLIALEREQIGLMKAIGYSSIAVGWHYLKLVIAISLAGIVVGVIAGTWLGRGLTEIYGEFFSFPFLIFRHNPDIYALAAGVSIASAIAGAVRAIGTTIALAPAVAMQPAAPTVYRQMFGGHINLVAYFSQLTVMALRHLVRRPVRAATTVLGISLAVALLVTALFLIDSVDSMIETVLCHHCS